MTDRIPTPRPIRFDAPVSIHGGPGDVVALVDGEGRTIAIATGARARTVTRVARGELVLLDDREAGTLRASLTWSEVRRG